MDTYKGIKENGGRYLWCKDFRETARIEVLEYSSLSMEASVVLLVPNTFYKNTQTLPYKHIPHQTHTSKHSSQHPN